MSLEVNDANLKPCHHSNELTFSPMQATFRIYIIPSMCFFGIFANLINICVFGHKQMVSHLVNHFFLALAVADLMVFFSTFFVFSMPVIAEHSGNFIFVDKSPVFLVFFYPVAHTAHMTTVYLTILVSVHRYLAICHPFLIRRISSPNAVKYVIFGVILFSILFNIPRWFELENEACISETFHSPAPLIQNYDFIIAYRIVLFIVVVFLIPFVTLTIVNFKIIEALQSSAKLVLLISYGITVMLVAIISEFLLFNVLSFVNNIVELIFHSSYFQFLVELSTVLVNLNGATTIIIYLIFGSKYRTVFFEVLNFSLKFYSCTINIRRSRARCSLSNYQRIFKNCICDNYWLQINELPIWAYIFAIIFQRKSLHFLCCSFIFITVRQKISENSTKNSLTICLKLYFQRTEINLNALSHDR
ncbi:unnamed protein product [Dracunculus medinensis]|uniref:G_PROTEIN_RECEP_F1_2 domain-containing protein n=1 Tax=Dracunculus medinensis TaxID=318479 RepID=A0A0N4U4H9_DRAME|nr:unnamed protein product [Dracunculus medinensis]